MTAPTIQEARPPYVSFEFRAVEDRAKSQETGHYVSKDLAYAIITPAGSKDRIEKLAEEWLENLKVQVIQERFPAQWLEHYSRAYQYWLKGQEIPTSGTPIRTWTVASPAQIKTLLDLHILTVEDLAATNEEAIMRMGMGGRALKQRAVDWLEQASSIGKATEEVTQMRMNLESANEQLAAQAVLIAQLSAKIEVLANGGAPMAGSQANPEDDGGLGFDLKVPTPSEARKPL